MMRKRSQDGRQTATSAKIVDISFLSLCIHLFFKTVTIIFRSLQLASLVKLRHAKGVVGSVGDFIGQIFLHNLVHHAISVGAHRMRSVGSIVLVSDG